MIDALLFKIVIAVPGELGKCCSDPLPGDKVVWWSDMSHSGAGFKCNRSRTGADRARLRLLFVFPLGFPACQEKPAQSTASATGKQRTHRSAQGSGSSLY